MRATCRALAVASVLMTAGAVIGGQPAAAAGPELVQEKVDPEIAKADVLIRAGVKAAKAEKWDRALPLFERALGKRNFSSDVYYNLVQCAKHLRLWDKVVLYAQGFLFLEPGTRDSLIMRDELDRAVTELAALGKPVVVHRFEVKPLLTPVLVDGVPVTSSGAIDVRLTAGPHTVSATKEDWFPWKQTLTVVAQTAPQTEPIVVTAALEPVPAVGHVTIMTTPVAGVEVYQDDVHIGTTPLPGPIELQTARRYLFRFEKPGFDRWHRYVEVFKGENLALQPVMEELPTTSRATIPAE